jgi:hypothetical protein
MAEGVGGLGFAQTPEANYDSILKAQSQINRQAASMARTQMATIQRDNIQGLKDAKENQKRIEDLKSQAIESVMYNVPYYSEIIGPLASQIAREDSRIPLQRAEQGLAVTFDQANTINQHDQAIKGFSNKLKEEFDAMESAGYYNLPLVKSAYTQHLIALNNGQVQGVGSKSIVDGAPTVSEYIAGPGGRFQPLGDDLMASFIYDDKYWTNWFDANNQEQKQAVKEGQTAGDTNITEGVSADLTQFTVYDQQLQNIRPKTATEIVNEGLLSTWFEQNSNYEGAILLREGAKDIVARNKLAETSNDGAGSATITIGNQEIKISDIDPADNGQPMAFTLLQAQVLSDRIAQYGMDNSNLSLTDIERRSMTIINNANKQEIDDTSYVNTFSKLSKVVFNENNILGNKITQVINGKEVVDITDMFSRAKVGTAALGAKRPVSRMFYDPNTKEFIAEYASSKEEDSYRTEYSTYSLREAIAGIQFFDRYSQEEAEQFLARKKAFVPNSDDVNLSVFKQGSEADYAPTGAAIAQLSNEFNEAIQEAVKTDSARPLRGVINNVPGGVPTNLGVVVSATYRKKEKEEDVLILRFDDGRKQEILESQINQIKVGIDFQTSMGQSSGMGQTGGVSLTPEQMQLLNRLG